MLIFIKIFCAVVTKAYELSPENARRCHCVEIFRSAEKDKSAEQHSPFCGKFDKVAPHRHADLSDTVEISLYARPCGSKGQ